MVVFHWRRSVLIAARARVAGECGVQPRSGRLVRNGTAGTDREGTAVMMPFRRAAVGLGTALLLAAGLATPSPAMAAGTFVPGSAGLGDPFFPYTGNGGYDVSHYALRLGYE